MPTHKLHWISALSLVLGVAVTGCAKDEGSDDTNGEETGGSSTDDPTATATMSASETTATMTGMSASTTTSDPSETESETEPGTISVTMTDPTGEDPLPDGSMCDSNEQCISEMCFVIGPLGGICGECLTDADCEGGGCSIPNPLAQPPEGATCNMGEPGEGCMSDEVCADGNVCAEILNVPGILMASTCSECREDADCTDGNLCSPSYDVANLSGIKTCVPPGSVPDGEGCDLVVSGNEACENFCVGADVLGVLMLGVCSACATDADCMMDETCMPPAIDPTAGLMAGACVPA